MSVEVVVSLKLTHPTQYPKVDPAGEEANLKARILQIWPTLRASIALFPCNFANKNETGALNIFNFAFKVETVQGSWIQGLELGLESRD